MRTRADSDIRGLYATEKEYCFDSNVVTFVKNYFSNPIVLVTAIKKYHEVSKVPKGEYTLLDLLR